MGIGDRHEREQTCRVSSSGGRASDIRLWGAVGGWRGGSGGKSSQHWHVSLLCMQRWMRRSAAAR